MTSTIKNLPKSEIELTITILSSDFKKTVESVMTAVVNNAEIQGFRKGKAPRNLVEKNIDRSKVYQEALQQILPKAYYDAIKEHNINPIVDPRIELVSPEKLTEIDEDKNLVIKARTAVKPEVKLKNYKDEIKKLKAKSSIWVPGKNQPDKKEEEKEGPRLEEIINVILENTEVELPNLLIEYEANKLLSQTLDEIKKLGLTLDQYLASTKKTTELLRSDAEEKARRDLKLEFVLDAIAKEEKIIVSEEEIEKVINENKDPKAKESLKSQSYLIATILLQQKTLDFVKNL